MINKITKRYKKFKTHPITRNAPFLALFRYLYFNIFHTITNKPRIYNWVNGLRFYAQKGDAGIVPNIYFKLFDYEDSSFIISCLDKDELFVDVGSNVGHFSLLAASTGANVISIEPIPSTYEKLIKNVELNQFQYQIMSLNIGIGNKHDFLWFSNTRGVMNSVIEDKSVNLSAEKVEVTTLDLLLEDKNPKILKIDVEGFEYFVLDGAKTTLMKSSLEFILIEINNSSNKFGKQNDDIHDFLLNYNFLPVKFNVTTSEFITQKSYNKDSFNTLYQRKC